MRQSRLALVVLCGCEKLFSLEVVETPTPGDAADARPADAAEPTLAATSLPAALDYNHPHTALIGDTLYIIGGYDVAKTLETEGVYRATSNNGELGAWTTTAALPAPRALGDIVTTDSRIYVVGGANFSVAQSTVYIGEPDAAGNISNWSPTSELPDPRKGTRGGRRPRLPTVSTSM